MKKYLFLLLVITTGLTACGPVLPIEAPQTPPSSPAAVSEATLSPLRIFVIDVGQGDATLVTGPSGRTLLIDAGPDESGILLPFLMSRQVSRLDWILLTHYDADHIGGMGSLLKGEDGLLGTDDDLYPSLALYDRGDQTDKTTLTYQSYLQLTGTLRHTLTANRVLDLGDGAMARVIVANGRYADGTVIHLNPDEENESSIGLLITYGHFRYFTAGDLTGGGAPGGFETKDMETPAGDIIGKIDVLHAGHHGSASSSNEHFLELTQPETAVISVGAHNDYHHPAAATLDRLESIGAAIFRTDERGTITIESDGEGYQIH